jgi:hypothetical protein
MSFIDFQIYCRLHNSQSPDFRFGDNQEVLLILGYGWGAISNERYCYDCLGVQILGEYM